MNCFTYNLTLIEFFSLPLACCVFFVRKSLHHFLAVIRKTRFPLLSFCLCFPVSCLRYAVFLPSSHMHMILLDLFRPCFCAWSQISRYCSCQVDWEQFVKCNNTIKNLWYTHGLCSTCYVVTMVSWKSNPWIWCHFLNTWYVDVLCCVHYLEVVHILSHQAPRRGRDGEVSDDELMTDDDFQVKS